MTHPIDIFNEVCRDLPPDWQVRVDLEQGSGCVVLVDPWGDDHSIHLDDASIEDMMRFAVQVAIRRDGDHEYNNPEDWNNV